MRHDLKIHTDKQVIPFQDRWQPNTAQFSGPFFLLQLNEPLPKPDEMYAKVSDSMSYERHTFDWSF